jgi:hypothetical protein
MVDDRSEVAVVAPIADLIDTDRDQALQAAPIEALCDDALNDPPDGVPGDSQQPGDRLLDHLLGKPRDHVLEVARVA